MSLTKDSYILNSLSKIRHKSWELFVISRILHKLDDPDVSFVCQQLVRRPNGKRALTDLYFPQFQLFLEVDERRHEQAANKEADKHRTEDIVSAANLIERRIRVSCEDGATPKPLHDVAAETDAFVNELRDLKAQAIASGEFVPWDFEGQYSADRHLSRGVLSLAGDTVFKFQREALRCLGYSGGHYQRGSWTLHSDPTRAAWFPRLYETDHWDNDLSPDGKVIRERKKAEGGGYEPLTYQEKWASRIVFARYQDNLGAALYRYLGEYQMMPEQGDKHTRVFVRIRENVDTISEQPPSPDTYSTLKEGEFRSS